MIKVNDRVGAIIADGQFAYNCTLLQIKTRWFRSDKYLVKYKLEIQGRKGEVLEFMGTRYPIASIPSYTKIMTEWVDEVWPIIITKQKKSLK